MKKLYLLLLFLLVISLQANATPAVQVTLPTSGSAYTMPFPFHAIRDIYSEFEFNADETVISTNTKSGGILMFDVATGIEFSGRDAGYWTSTSTYIWDPFNPYQIIISQFDGLLRRWEFPHQNNLLNYSAISPDDLDPMELLAEVNTSRVFNNLFAVSDYFIGIANTTVYEISSNFTLTELGVIPYNYSHISVNENNAYVSVNDTLFVYSALNFTNPVSYNLSGEITFFSVSKNDQVIVQVYNTMYTLVNNQIQLLDTISNLIGPRFSTDGKYITVVADNTTIQIRSASDFSLVNVYNFTFENKVFDYNVAMGVLDSHHKLHFIDYHMYQMDTETLDIKIYTAESIKPSGWPTTEKTFAYFSLLPFLVVFRKHKSKRVII